MLLCVARHDPEYVSQELYAAVAGSMRNGTSLTMCVLLSVGTICVETICVSVKRYVLKRLLCVNNEAMCLKLIIWMSLLSSEAIMPSSIFPHHLKFWSFNLNDEKASLIANYLRLRTLSRGTTLFYNLIPEITSHVRHYCDTLGTIMGAPNVFYFHPECDAPEGFGT